MQVSPDHVFAGKRSSMPSEYDTRRTQTEVIYAVGKESAINELRAELERQTAVILQSFSRQPEIDSLPESGVLS